jgi:hypothetical protein
MSGRRLARSSCPAAAVFLHNHRVASHSGITACAGESRYLLVGATPEQAAQVLHAIFVLHLGICGHPDDEDDTEVEEDDYGVAAATGRKRKKKPRVRALKRAERLRQEAETEVGTEAVPASE